MKRSTFAALATSGALALLAAGAQAATITYTTDDTSTTIGETQTNWNTTTPPPNPLLLPQFNPGSGGIPAGAVLTGVSVTVRGSGSFEYGVENLSTTEPTSGNVELFTRVTFQVPGAGSVTVQPTYTSPNLNLTIYDGTTDYAGSSGFSVDTTGSPTYASQTVNPSSPWAAYIGGGNVTINVGAIGGKTSFLSGGNPQEVTETYGDAYATVTYTYDVTTTPEPASIALMGLGLAGLGLWRRRKV